MEQIQFTNKLWISSKGRISDKILNICCWIYLPLVMIVILMEGGQLTSVLTCIAAIAIIIRTRSNMEQSGYYVEAMCKITFMKQKIIWEYPEVDLSVYKGCAAIKYDIDAEKIKSISISNEIQSLRLECSPLITYTNGKKQKFIDYRKKNKSCVLIVYNYDLRSIQELFEKYINIKVETIE